MQTGFSTPTNIAQALRADFVLAQKGAGLSAQRVNIAFGHSETSSWAYQLLDGDVAFPVAQLEIWIQLTRGRHLVKYLAEKANMIAIEKPGGEPTLGTAHKALQAFTGFLGRLSSATDPDSPGGRLITREEGVDVWARSLNTASVILSAGRAALVSSQQTNDGRRKTLADADLSLSPLPKGRAGSPSTGSTAPFTRRGA